MKPVRGTFIQFACATNQTIENVSKTKYHSLFTKHLLQNITEENITIASLFRRITDNVYQESSQTQRPFSINGLPEDWQISLNEVSPGMYK